VDHVLQADQGFADLDFLVGRRGSFVPRPDEPEPEGGALAPSFRATTTSPVRALVAVDWGTSSLRAARIAGDGTVLEQRASERGILTVPVRRFPRHAARDGAATGSAILPPCAS
jgi:hypothetical protein